MGTATGSRPRQKIRNNTAIRRVMAGFWEHQDQEPACVTAELRNPAKSRQGSSRAVSFARRPGLIAAGGRFVGSGKLMSGNPTEFSRRQCDIAANARTA